MAFNSILRGINCRCAVIPIYEGELAMGDEADRLIDRQMMYLPCLDKRVAHRASNKDMAMVLDMAEKAEAEGPREPSTRTTCNRCGTTRLHWTGDKQAGTLVMRDEHGFVHKCPDYGVKLNLTL
jgi:hypothetical protein